MDSGNIPPRPKASRLETTLLTYLMTSQSCTAWEAPVQSGSKTIYLDMAAGQRDSRSILQSIIIFRLSHLQIAQLCHLIPAAAARKRVWRRI